MVRPLIRTSAWSGCVSRVCVEPGRLWKRYLVTYTLFILGAFCHLQCGPGKSR